MKVNKKTTTTNQEIESVRPSRLRKMKPYHPRKRADSKPLTKQLLSDFEHQLTADLGRFLVLLEEGSAEQITQASQKARSDFLKLKDEMLILASDLGGTFPALVAHFLDSVDMILHTGSGWLDPEKISQCYKATQKLEMALKIKQAKHSE
jgi:hypothetical protein